MIGSVNRSRRLLTRPVPANHARRIPVGKPDRLLATRLLRRSTLAPTEGVIDQFAGADQHAIVDHLLDDARSEIDRTESWQNGMPGGDDWQPLLRWWVQEMKSPEAGLVDRMTWFWHSHLTTAANKVDSTYLVREQLRTLRSSCLGNFGDLLHAFVRDGALIRYLDAEWSEASNPNENLARELMELFTIGRGHYSQDDVRAAARALAGWRISREEGENPEVWFDRTGAFIAPLVFMGEMDEWDTQKIVDRLLAHPSTAQRISARLWHHLTGVELDENAAAELGAWWQGQDLEILPLVERVLRDEAAVGQTLRPRTGIEWYIAALTAADLEPTNLWSMEELGQMPYSPPNVAGWKAGGHWLRPGSLLARASFVHNVEWDESLLQSTGSTERILLRCGIAEIAPSTNDAFSHIDRFTDLPSEARARNRWRLALNAPEFHLQ